MTGGTEGFSVSLSDLSAPSVATEPIIKDWHLAPGTWHLAPGLRLPCGAMRIIGLGVDLADISRVDRILSRYPRFARRCFTPHEQEYAERFARPARRYAARFAGKEAVMKSLGTGYRQLRWTDIEITGGGKPTVNLTGTAAARADQLGVTGIEVAITHTDTDALVFAVALGEH